MRTEIQWVRLLLTILLAGLSSIYSVARTPVQSERDFLEVLLVRAAENARRYTDAMRNLTADETRTTELFDKNGNRRQRVTVSDYLVHTAGENTLAEFRRVRAVDGRPVKNGDRHLEEFLGDLSKSDSIEHELQLIDAESSRYDLGDMRMKGMALNQAWPLEKESFRNTATFRIEGREVLSGKETWIVQFEAPTAIPDSLRDSLDAVEPERVFVRGRIWIEVESGQIWKSEIETFVDGKSLKAPAVWDRMEFLYRSNMLGVVTPESIVWTSYAQVRRDRNGVSFALKGRVTARYGDFRRFGTDVQIVPATPR